MLTGNPYCHYGTGQSNPHSNIWPIF